MTEEQTKQQVFECVKKQVSTNKAVQWLDNPDSYELITSMLEADCNRPGAEFAGATRTPSGELVFKIQTYAAEITSFYSAQTIMTIAIPPGNYLVYEIESLTKRAVNPVVITPEEFRGLYSITSVSNDTNSGVVLLNRHDPARENVYVDSKIVYAIKWNGENRDAVFDFCKKFYTKAKGMIEADHDYISNRIDSWLTNPYNKGFYISYFEGGTILNMSHGDIFEKNHSVLAAGAFYPKKEKESEA